MSYSALLLSIFNPHPMKIFVHKYSATDGKILKLDATMGDEPNSARVLWPWTRYRQWISQRDYSLTESEARAEADKRIGKKIAAAEKAIAKLVKMREAITVVDNTNP